jgi:hypothetical protein
MIDLVSDETSETHETHEPREAEHLARLQIDFDFLVGLLKLPAGTAIRAIFQDPAYPKRLDIVVANPQLHPVFDGSPIEVISPCYQRDLRSGEHWETSFVSWGQT